MTTALARWFSIQPAPTATVDPKGARRANLRAQRALATEQARTHETAESASSLRALREENHWSDLLTDAYGLEKR